MITLSAVTHDIRTHTLEATWRDVTTLVAVKCHNYSPTQIGTLRADDISLTGADSTQPYITAAGWTPSFVATYTAEQERLAAEVREKADAEAAAQEAARVAAEQVAFDADVKRQAAIIKAAQAMASAE